MLPIQSKYEDIELLDVFLRGEYSILHENILVKRYTFI